VLDQPTNRMAPCRLPLAITSSSGSLVDGAVPGHRWSDRSARHVIRTFEDAATSPGFTGDDNERADHQEPSHPQQQILVPRTRVIPHGCIADEWESKASLIGPPTPHMKCPGIRKDVVIPLRPDDESLRRVPQRDDAMDVRDLGLTRRMEERHITHAQRRSRHSLDHDHTANRKARSHAPREDRLDLPGSRSHRDRHHGHDGHERDKKRGPKHSTAKAPARALPGPLTRATNSGARPGSPHSRRLDLTDRHSSP